MVSVSAKQLKRDILIKSRRLFSDLDLLGEVDRIDTINKLRKILHKYSLFVDEPVDCVQWMLADHVQANDYNPNIVAPPEMELLKHSIERDGYTQPIVAWEMDGDNKYEVVDGFHRNKVGKEYDDIKRRVKGYLPLVIINEDRTEKGDRIASTIRHNRARGKHQVKGMSDIVIELKNRNWKNERIARELGMEPDEILRLCQITGLTGLFSDQEFSKSWDVEDLEDFTILSGDPNEIEVEAQKHGFRTVNTSDEDRIFHTWEKWECHKAGFYATTKEGMTREECEEAYRDFLSDIKRFAEVLEHVINEWKYSCEHYLTNAAMNRIAWLGQAAMCYETGIPHVYRGGFYLLTEEQQKEANETALIYLNKWLKANRREEVTLDEGLADRQVDLY